MSKKKKAQEVPQQQGSPIARSYMTIAGKYRVPEYCPPMCPYEGIYYDMTSQEGAPLKDPCRHCPVYLCVVPEGEKEGEPLLSPENYPVLAAAAWERWFESAMMGPAPGRRTAYKMWPLDEPEDFKKAEPLLSRKIKVVLAFDVDVEVRNIARGRLNREIDDAWLLDTPECVSTFELHERVLKAAIRESKYLNYVIYETMARKIADQTINELPRQVDSEYPFNDPLSGLLDSLDETDKSIAKASGEDKSLDHMINAAIYDPLRVEVIKTKILSIEDRGEATDGDAQGPEKS